MISLTDLSVNQGQGLGKNFVFVDLFMGMFRFCFTGKFCHILQIDRNNIRFLFFLKWNFTNFNATKRKDFPRVCCFTSSLLAKLKLPFPEQNLTPWCLVVTLLGDRLGGDSVRGSLFV